MATDAPFARVQRKLLAAWQADRPGTTIPHLVVALPSVSLDPVLLSHYGPRIPALEQRYLYSVMLLENPVVRVVFVSSQAVPAYLIRYYVSLVPGLELADVRRRLTLISLDDASPRPLSHKLLKRPDLLDQIRLLARDGPALIEPWNVSSAERELAIALDMPIYGAHPRLWRLGTKSGGRRLFAEEGVPTPPGVEDVGTSAEIVAAARRLRSEDPALGAVVVKLNDSAAGDGNAVIDLRGLPTSGSASERAALERRLLALPEWYVKSLGLQRGIVEAWIEGADFSSPSAQLGLTPDGGVTVLSTHDQVLGGHSGQVYEGCRFPARDCYARQVADYGAIIGRRLSDEGVIGRASVDFATVRRGDRWHSYALEINLRKGGTTHPMGTARQLLRGEYDVHASTYHDRAGEERCYVSTDNLVDDAWRALEPTEVVARVAEAGLAYDPHRRTGVVLHMLECLPIDGRFGLTAFGATRAEAEALYAAVPKALA